MEPDTETQEETQDPAVQMAEMRRDMWTFPEVVEPVSPMDFEENPDFPNPADYPIIVSQPTPDENGETT